MSVLVTQARQLVSEIVPLGEVTGLETPEEIYDLLIRATSSIKEEATQD